MVQQTDRFEGYQTNSRIEDRKVKMPQADAVLPVCLRARGRTSFDTYMNLDLGEPERRWHVSTMAGVMGTGMVVGSSP